MSDMISRADAAAICDKHSYSNNQFVSMRMMDAAREIRALTATPSADVAGLRNICRSMPDIPGLHETYQPRNIAAALDGYICALARMKEAGE